MGRSIEIARAFLRARYFARPKPRPRMIAVPIETAAEYEARFADRNRLGLSLEDARRQAERELAGEPPAFPGYSFGLSTGTTGRPGVFITSESERNAWIGAVLGKFVAWRLLLNSNVALILRHNNRLYSDVTRTRGLRLHYYNAGAPIDEWVGRLCDLQPEIVIGPPSILEGIARTEAFGRRPLRPRLLLAGAEPLFPQDDFALSRAYGVRPRLIYQAKEGFLGFSCDAGSFHLNEDLIHFEQHFLERGRFVPVISDLARTSQTYRRYRLDDILIRGDIPCGCGSLLLRVQAVEGRAQDVLLLPSHRRLFPSEVNECLLPHLRGRDYQVAQPTEDQLTLAVDGGITRELLDSLADRAGTRVTEASYTITAPGEKRRRVRRLFDPHNDWLGTRPAGISPLNYRRPV